MGPGDQLRDSWSYLGGWEHYVRALALCLGPGFPGTEALVVCAQCAPPTCCLIDSSMPPTLCLPQQPLSWALIVGAGKALIRG